MKPPAGRTAWFLDLDGTLLDIASTPDAVRVTPDLPDTLRALRARDGDALAIVTGRSVAVVDALLGDLPYAVAGEHGAAIRPAPGADILAPDLPDVPEGWRPAARDFAAAVPAARFEDKTHGFVLHFRQCPDQGAVLRAHLETLLAGDPRFVILSAKMAWEVRPRDIDKGAAVRRLMALPPFAGRQAFFAGDDVTDEDGIAAARALGGSGLRIGEDLPDAAAFRSWLRDAAFTRG